MEHYITGFVCDTLSYALMLAVDYAPKVEKLTVEFLSCNCMSYKSESYKNPFCIKTIDNITFI